MMEPADNVPSLGTEAIIEGWDKRVRQFMAAGVELGFFEVSGSDDDGELRYRSTAKWKATGEEEASRIIGRFQRGERE